MSGLESSDLAGGLTVVSEKVQEASSIAIAIAVGRGSRDESNDEAGWTHFVEHLLFRGTRTRTAREIATAFDSMGGLVDAMTSRESTVLGIRVAPADAGEAMEHLLGMLAGPSLGEVDTERKVILEEIAMIEDDHSERLAESLSARVHGDHPLGRPIIGSPESIASAGRDDLARFHSRCYARSAIVAAAAGAVDHEWFAETVDRGLAELAVGEPVPRTAPQPVPGTCEDIDLPGEQVHIQLAGLGPGREGDERFALAAMTLILGESASSRLFTSLREDRGLAYDTGAWAAPAIGASEVGVYISTGPGTAAEAADALGAEVSRYRSGGPTGEEVERAKRQLKARYLLSRESLGERSSSALSAVLAGRRPLADEEVLAAIDSITVEAVSGLAERVFDPRFIHSGSAGPGAAFAATALESASSGSLGA